MNAKTSGPVAAFAAAVAILLAFPANAAATASLVVTVTSVAGTPVSGATVTLSGPQCSSQATTDEHGRAVISSCPPDTYTVTVTASGFETFTQANIPLMIDATQSVTASLQPQSQAAPPPPPPLPPPTAAPTPAATPAPIAKPTVASATIALYNALHPEHIRGTPYFGRYTYVLLHGRSDANRALVTALVEEYTIGELSTGAPQGLQNPWGYNLFLLPIRDNASGIEDVDTAKIVTGILARYNWISAENIRTKYCGMASHSGRSLCRSPYDSGPILITFLRPLEEIKPRDPLPPSLAYDLSDVPDTQMQEALKKLASSVQVPQPIVNDVLLPPPFATRYIAPLLASITRALQASIPHVKTFADGGMLPK